MNNYYVEIRPGVRRTGPPNLVPLADVHRYIGFRSVFAYDADVAELIRAQGSTGNLRGRPVYCDQLLMDFDNHSPDEFRTWLQSSGLAYTEWDSGNRSIHYHIPMQPVFGAWVPQACKDWTKEHAPTADISFYHAAGMYRLGGTFHPKRPGRRKVMLHEQQGTVLVLPEPPKRQFNITIQDEATIEDFFAALLTRKQEGGRQPWLWVLGTKAAELGMEFYEALEHLRWWNRHHCQPPHPDNIVQRQCESAYRQAANRSRHG